MMTECQTDLFHPDPARSMQSSLPTETDHPLLPVFILGRSGAGKQVYTTMHIADYLARGKSVMVLDWGRSYHALSRTLGGTYLTLREEGGFTVEVHGSASLTVCEFDAIRSTWTWPLPPGPRHDDMTDGLVVVDESLVLQRIFPQVVNAVGELLRDGASFCITGQCIEDVDAFLPLSPSFRTIRLSVN